MLIATDNGRRMAKFGKRSATCGELIADGILEDKSLKVSVCDGLHLAPFITSNRGALERK